MTPLCRFNGDFEYELAHTRGTYHIPARVTAMNLELAHFMQFLRPEAPWILNHLEAEGQPLGMPDGACLEYLPWGVTPRTWREARAYDPTCVLPDPAVVRAVQDRRFCTQIALELEVALPGEQLLTSWEALERALAITARPLVIKHPFGMNARQRLLLREAAAGLSSKGGRWCRQVLETHGMLTIEPWVRRAREFGIQWWIPGAGAPRLMGVVEILSTPNGSYAGHRLVPRSLPDGILELTVEAARRVQQAGYFGPMGIDAFEYLDQEGALRLRPLVEINARHTTGMCALGLRRHLPESGCGLWLHFDRKRGLPPQVVAGLADCPYDPLTRVGVLQTSPNQVGSTELTRCSILWSFPSEERLEEALQGLVPPAGNLSRLL